MVFLILYCLKYFKNFKCSYLGWYLGMKFCKLLKTSWLGPYQWIGFYMIGTSVMKEVTTLNSKFTKSEVKKENKLSRSPNFDFTCIHFNIYECFKCMEKPLWLINTKSCDNTDMFNKYRSRSPKVVCKNGVLDSFAKFTRNHLCRSLLLKK